MAHGISNQFKNHFFQELTCVQSDKKDFSWSDDIFYRTYWTVMLVKDLIWEHQVAQIKECMQYQTCWNLTSMIRKYMYW